MPFSLPPSFFAAMPLACQMLYRRRFDTVQMFMPLLMLSRMRVLAMPRC